MGWEAGWTATVSTPTGEEGFVEFSRYVGGVESPDADLQSAHFAQLEHVLAEGGFDFERRSHGLVVEGQINPISAAAPLVRALSAEAREQIVTGEGPVEEAVFAGTCFAFRHSNVFLTAAHCVEGAEPGDLFVNPPRAPGGTREVVEVHRHPVADIALLKLADDVWLGGVEPFVDHGDAPGLGADFMAYGFPEDYPHPEALESSPTARLSGDTSNAVCAISVAVTSTRPGR